MMLRAVFSKGAHQPPLVVGILETVEKHVVKHLAVPHAVAAPGLVQQIGRVGHAFHAARHDQIDATGAQRIVGEDRRLHTRAAHLVQRGAGGRLAQPGTERRLACRRLAEAGRQHTAHQHLLHLIGRYAAAFDRCANRGGAQLRRAEAFQVALETAHGRTGRTENDDWIVVHRVSPIISRPCATRRRGGSPRR